MSIISKLKGDKKVAESEKKDGGKSNSSAQDQNGEQRPAAARTWTAENMQQVNRTVMQPMHRTSSDLSVRSSRPHIRRSGSALSQEWTPASSNHRASSSSLRTISKNSSFLGLAKVMEDGSDDRLGIPPMPPMPIKYSAASSSSSSRPRSSRSPYSASGSSIGRSPLSSAEVSFMDSEDDSNASSKSEDILEMRSHPYSHPEQFVFGGDQDRDIIRIDSKGKGKGKAPMFPLGVNVPPLNRGLDDEEVHVASPRDSKFSETLSAPSERRYFTKATPLGEASEVSGSTTPVANKTSVAPAAVSKPVKKGRFSFLKKADNSVTAH